MRLNGIKGTAFVALCATLSIPLASTVSPASADASGTGGEIVFSRSDASTQTADLFLMSSDGSGTVQLTAGNGDLARDPAWAPDGSTIAFSDGNEYGGTTGIAVIGADGSGLTRLTSGATDTSPAWSPDGLKIAFSRQNQSSGNNGIFVMNADGTSLTQLTTGAYDIAPAWSPDGSKIAFQSGVDSQIYVMNADGTDPISLTNDWPGKGTAPQWSPDGTKIVFTSSRDSNTEVYVMDADGTHQTNLTNNSAQDQQPSWSPDGTSIVFSSSRGGGLFGLYAMAADGSNPTSLTSGATYGDSGPQWSSSTIAPAASSPALGISGDTNVVAGLPASYAITNAGKPLSLYSWSVSPSNCAIAQNNLATATVLCPAEDTGSMTVTMVGGVTGDPTRYTVQQMTTLDAPNPVLELQQTDGAELGDYVAIQGTSTTGDGTPLFGTMTMDVSEDGGGTWSRVASLKEHGTMIVVDQPTTATPEYRLTFAGATTTLDLALTLPPSTLSMSVAGQGIAAQFAGTLTSRGEPITNVTVALQEQPKGTTTWTTVATAVTGTTGGYATAYAVTTPGQFRWSWAGDSTHAPTVSVATVVKAATTLGGGETRSRTGVETLFAHLRTGSGAALTGQVVLLQQKVGAGWKTIKWLRTSVSGGVTYANTKTGKLQFRWLFSGTASYAASASKVLTAW